MSIYGNNYTNIKWICQKVTIIYKKHIIILKVLEVKEMKGILKKTLGVCLIGLGVGILMLLLLPITGWLILIGLIIIAVGFIWLAC